MNRPTRFYSNKQEKQVAKALSGKKIANSGATTFEKGDVKTELFLIECKTCIQEKQSFTLKKEWFIKNEEEAFAMGKLYNALAFDFGDGDTRYIISEDLFKYLNKKLLEVEEL